MFTAIKETPLISESPPSQSAMLYSGARAG